MPMTIETSQLHRPACAWSWAAEPKLRRLAVGVRRRLRLRWVMAGLHDRTNRLRDRERRLAATLGTRGGVEASAMPLDPRLWLENPPPRAIPACQAVVAAREQGPEAAGRYLRRLREGLLRAQAARPRRCADRRGGGRRARPRNGSAIDLGSHAITEAFAADLDEVRDPSVEAREQGKVGETEGPTASLSLGRRPWRGWLRAGVWGWRPYEAYREAAIAAGARSSADRPRSRSRRSLVSAAAPRVSSRRSAASPGPWSRPSSGPSLASGGCDVKVMGGTLWERP